MRAFSEGHMTSLKKEREKEESLNNATTNLCLLRTLEARVGDDREVNLNVCRVLHEAQRRYPFVEPVYKNIKEFN